MSVKERKKWRASFKVVKHITSPKKWCVSLNPSAFLFLICPYLVPYLYAVREVQAAMASFLLSLFFNHFFCSHSKEKLSKPPFTKIRHSLLGTPDFFFHVSLI